MTLLLDTHALLWWLDDPALLSAAANNAIADGRNTVYVSAAAAWEIAIKQALGKLTAPDELEAVMAANRFHALPVTIAHALGINDLPPIHRDPFDRLMLSQAKIEGLTFVSRDVHVPHYGVAYLPA